MFTTETLRNTNVTRHSELVRIRQGRPAAAVTLLCALFVVVFDNFHFWASLYRSTPPESMEAVAMYGIVFIALVMIYNALFSLLALRWLLKPMLSLILMVAAACAYFMDAFGVIINDSMLRNVLETDAGEAAELLSPRLLIYLGLLGVLPGVLLWRTPIRHGALSREVPLRLITTILSLMIGVGVLFTHYKYISFVARQHNELRYLLNPYYPVWSARKLLPSGEAAAPDPRGRTATQAAATVTAKPTVLVLVVGETARAANFQLDGYARATNPRLSDEPLLINYTQVTSCGTATAVSVPCMFSRLPRSEFSHDKAKANVDFVQVLQTAGVSVYWRENDGGCKGVCVGTDFQDLSHGVAPDLCDDDGCQDGVMIRSLSAILDHLRGDTLIVLHPQGSHGPAYYRRYPEAFRRFTPDCRTQQVQTCSQPEIVNAYDNTIVYTDDILAEVIAQLRRRADGLDTAMLYLSDHGESLGENGLYLHGMPYSLAPAEQTHVPFMLWLSPQLEAHAGLRRQCLLDNADISYSHDNLFHSVLGLFRIRTDAYEPAMDILEECRG